MIDIMNNKQISNAIFGCSGKLLDLNNKMQRFYQDISGAEHVRKIVNEYYQKNKELISDKNAVITITNEMVQEQYTLIGNKFKMVVSLKTYKPMCMRNLTITNTGNYSKYNDHLREYKSSLSVPVQLKEHQDLQVDEFINKLMFLYRKGYCVECDSDKNFFCSIFESAPNKTSIGLIIDSL